MNSILLISAQLPKVPKRTNMYGSLLSSQTFVPEPVEKLPSGRSLRLVTRGFLFKKTKGVSGNLDAAPKN